MMYCNGAKRCWPPLVTEPEILAFVRASLASTWELELLLLLFRSPERSWSAEELVRELRASQEVVARGVRHLLAQDLMVARDGRFAYARGQETRDALINGLRLLCTSKPFTVLNTIRDAQAEPLRTFSDAFKFRE